MKGYVYFLSAPLIAMGAVDTSGSLNKEEMFLPRGNDRASVQPQTGHLQILQFSEAFSAVSAVTPATISPRAFSKDDPGFSHAADIASPVSSITNLPVADAAIANVSASVSAGSGVIASSLPSNKEHAASGAFARKIKAAGTSPTFTQPAAIGMATVPQIQQISVSTLASGKAVVSLPATITSDSKETSTKIRSAKLARTGLKTANLGIGTGKALQNNIGSVNLPSTTYGTSARNAHKVYFPMQLESSAGALQADSGMAVGSAKIDRREKARKGGFDHYEETSTVESADSSQLKSGGIALKDDRSDQPELSLDEKKEILSERGDAAREVASLNQPLETGSVY